MITRRRPLKRSQKRASPKTNEWAHYGLKKPGKPRFKGLAGVLWFVLSRYVRKSEFLAYGGMCVDGCGRYIPDWHEADCGHFMASSKGFCTRFQRENLGLQTKYCNNPLWSPDSSYGFGVMIDKRYGAGTALRLSFEAKKICKEYSPLEYDREIRKYIDLFYQLPELA